MKAVQKIVKNGNSAQVTIPRQLLFHLGLRLGDWVEITALADGEFHVRPWKDRENISQRSPGVMPEAAPAVSR